MFYKRWTETVAATLSVLVVISVYKSREWTGYVRNRFDGVYGRLTVAPAKSIEKLASAVSPVGRAVGVVVTELIDVFNELLGVDLIAAINDVVRGDLVTGPNYLESIGIASEATARAGHVLGGQSPEEQEKTRLSVSIHIMNTLYLNVHS